MSAFGNTPAMVPDPAHALDAKRQPAPAPAGQPAVRQPHARPRQGSPSRCCSSSSYYAAKHGASQLSFSFLTAQLPAPGGIVPGGGMGPALVGTAEVVLIATVIALPVGLLTAIYLTEFASLRIGRVLTTALEQMAGLPTILVGVFICGTDRRRTTDSRGSPPDSRSRSSRCR